jgi:polyhydroxybutyrate depolymerase
MSWSRAAGSLARVTCKAVVALVASSCAPRESAPPSPTPSSSLPYAPPAGAPSSATPVATNGGSPGCGTAPTHAGASVQHVKALGRERAYTLVVPEGYAPQTPYPLVFVLHGGGGSAATARAQTDLENASGGHAIFVYPDSTGGNWNLDAPAATNGDVALFDAVLLVVHNTLCVDERRVFVTGFSNGAYMANQLGCKRGERIRAVVTHAGGGPYETSGSYDATGHLVCPGKAVASLVVHGNNDGTVPPTEGQKSIDHWSYANRCGAGAASAFTPPCVALQGCFQPVGVCRVPGLGHGLWSQAGKVTWAFFEALK